jgi:hypothetical protein
MYLYQNKLLPRSFDNLFLRTNQVHKYDTRNSNLYHIPFCIEQKLDNFQLLIRLQNFLIHLVRISVMHHLFIVFNLN